MAKWAKINAMTKTSATALASQGLMGVARDNYPMDGTPFSFVASFAEVEVEHPMRVGDHGLAASG